MPFGIVQQPVQKERRRADHATLYQRYFSYRDFLFLPGDNADIRCSNLHGTATSLFCVL
jgi:hypothetical protein